MAGRLTGCVVGRSGDWVVGWVRLGGWMAGWVADWVAGWVAGWLTRWLTRWRAG